MGGCGIAIKKRGSPVVMLLMMEYGQGENVTLGKSTWTVTVWVIRGDEAVGDIPGVRGGSRGGLKIVHKGLD